MDSLLRQGNCMALPRKSSTGWQKDRQGRQAGRQEP